MSSGMDDSDEEKSWSFVDEQEARDQTPGVFSSKSIGASGSRQYVSKNHDSILAEDGNNSPAYPAVLEAVTGTSHDKHQQEQTSSSSAAISAPQDLESAELNYKATEKSGNFEASQPSDNAEALHLHGGPSPIISEGDSSTSDSLYAPHDLPQLQTATDYAAYKYSDEDDMSQSSSNTAVMIENPCSDEEDNAERRWRLGMQRQDDIRRAQAPPCPIAEGTERFLKVIVVGEAGLGKTTFIQNLQAAFQPELHSPRPPQSVTEDANLYEVFKHSPEHLCTEVTINTDASSFHYLLQDTPGLVYGQTNVRIPAHISKQNRKYLEREQDPLRTQPMSATPDHRVDACLFFLNPNHLKDAEVTAMIQISELVPVVPMIAKADIFEERELAAFRLSVQRRMAAEEAKLGRPIMWQPAAAPAIDDETEQRRLQPPFAVIASSHTDLAVGRFWPVRSYPWGRCEALSSTNSDLPLLKKLLFEEGFAKLKQATEERYYKFRTAHLTEAATKQMDMALPECDEEVEGDGEYDFEPEDSGPESESEDTAHHTANDCNRAGEGRFVERRSPRNFWMWGMVLTGLLCTALIGNVSQLRADKRALQHKLNAKDQDTLHVEMAVQEGQPKQVIRDKKNSSGTGSACTDLISAWRLNAVPAQHTRRQPLQAAAQNETAEQLVDEQAHPEHAPLARAQTSQGSGSQLQPDKSGQNQSSTALVPHRPSPFLCRSQQALQRAEQAASAVGSLARSAGASSLAAVHCTSKKAVAYGAAASKAIATFLHHVAEDSCGVGRRTSLAVYQGVSSGWTALVQRLGTVQQAVLTGQQAVVEGARAFSHDVAQASRVMVRDAPEVVRRMQQDVSRAAGRANDAVKHLCHAVSHKFMDASQQVDQAAQQAMQVMQNTSMSHWNAKVWIRFAARLGMLGAAL